MIIQCLSNYAAMSRRLRQHVQRALTKVESDLESGASLNLCLPDSLPTTSSLLPYQDTTGLAASDNINRCITKKK